MCFAKSLSVLLSAVRGLASSRPIQAQLAAFLSWLALMK